MVEYNSDNPAGFADVLARLPGRAILHGHRYIGRSFADRLRYMLMSGADALLMYGYEKVATMVRRGIDPAKIVIAPNTIEVANHADFSHEAKTGLLFAGRFLERKHLDLALEVFDRLQDSSILESSSRSWAQANRRRRCAISSLGSESRKRCASTVVSSITESWPGCSGMPWRMSRPDRLGWACSTASRAASL